MKIGIVTFHWGTNYGGVLQSYALQNFLQKMGHEVYMVNYYPVTHSESLLKCVKTKSLKVMMSNLKTYFKEKNFIPFRIKHLALTKRYFNLQELQADPPNLDAYVCGSDQVWNPYIISTYGMPYYLNFGDKAIKRISYAVSFGCIDYPDKELGIIRPLIDRFDAISVRENSGLAILGRAGINRALLMPDPTLLLQRDDLDKLILPYSSRKDDFVFFYILQEDQECINKVLQHAIEILKEKTVNNRDLKYSTMGIESWLGNIRDSKFVVTNSFHGVVFSILFKKNFVVIPIEGKHAGMNDRIYTILDRFDLRHKLLETYDEAGLNNLIDKEIDWKKVEVIQKDLQNTARNYFEENATVSKS